MIYIHATTNARNATHPKACGGRISVTELPNEMGIGMEHLEARVEASGENWGSLGCHHENHENPVLNGMLVEFK